MSTNADAGELAQSWGARTAYVAGAVLVMTCAFVIVKTGRDALYFQGRGLMDLPKAYLGITALSLPVAAAMLELMRRAGVRRARVLANALFAALLIGFAPFARPGGGVVMTVFFVLVPLVFGVLFSSSWLLAADLLDRAPRARLARAFAHIGAASMLGGVLGGAVCKLLVTQAPPHHLIAWGGGVLLLAPGILAAAHRRYPLQVLKNARNPGQPQPSEVRSALRDRYTVLLIVIAITASLVGVLIEFQFYLAAGTSGNTGQQNVDFFANVYMLLSAGAFVVQIVVMPRIQDRLGIARSLLILPAILLGVASALFVRSTLGWRTLLRLAEGGVKSSIHRANWEQAYVALPRERRPLTKLLVDGGGARFGEGVAALVLQIWLTFVVAGEPLVGRDVGWVTWLLVGAMLAWLLLTRVLGRWYAACPGASDANEMRLDVPLPDT